MPVAPMHSVPCSFGASTPLATLSSLLFFVSIFYTFALTHFFEYAGRLHCARLPFFASALLLTYLSAERPICVQENRNHGEQIDAGVCERRLPLRWMRRIIARFLFNCSERTRSGSYSSKRHPELAT